MTWTDAKFYMVNSVGLMAMLSKMDDILSVLIGFVVLGYSIHKWYLMHKNEGTK